MRWKGDVPRGLPGWAAALVALIGGWSILIYLLLCLFLAVYLWFSPIVF